MSPFKFRNGLIFYAIFRYLHGAVPITHRMATYAVPLSRLSGFLAHIDKQTDWD
jgi:hypothetical protein